MKKSFLISALIVIFISLLCIPFASAYNIGDDYPADLKSVANNTIVDPWNFYNRQCTSFVAWCLNTRNGIHFTNQYGGVERWGNANSWDNVASSLGITVDTSPAVGSVAVRNSGTYGHVMWVRSVDGSGITIEEYNKDGSGEYNERTLAYGSDAYNALVFIHIADIGNGPTPVPIVTTPPPDCTCSSAYAGQYVCTTSSKSLNIRSGHGTGYSSVGSIPSGATVTVTRANGTWAHVTYNGISGYACMQDGSNTYLTRSGSPQVTPTPEPVSFQQDRIRASIDLVESIGHKIHIYGWAYDTTSPSSQVSIHVYHGGGLTSCNTTAHRPDVNSAFGIDGLHGFDFTYDTGLTGTYSIQLNACFVDGTGSLEMYKGNLTYTNEYTVSYNANNGTGAPASQKKIEGKTLVLSSQMPTRTGYTFLGWAKSSTGSVAYYPGGNYTANANQTLYAVWERITYNVTLHENDGSDESSILTKEYGVDLTLPSTVSERAGYDFLGWATSAYGNAEYSPGAVYSADANIDLYTVWRIKTFTIAYDPNGGSGVPDARIKMYGDTVALSETIPIRQDYLFVGWATSADGEAAYQPEDEYDRDEDITLYAVWEFNVTLESLRITPKTVNLEVGDRAQLVLNYTPSNARPVVTWLSSNAETASIDDTGLITALTEGASVITAATTDGQFSATAKVIVGSGTFNVSFDPNGGSGAPEAMTLGYGEAFTIPAKKPTRTGNIFKGWSYEVDGDVVFQPGDETVADRSCVLYAIWTPNTYPVIYNANGGTGAPAPGVKVYGQPYEISATKPTREGYSFVGWATGSGAAAPEFLPGDQYTTESLLRLYAVWRERPRAVTLNYSTLYLSIGETRTLKPTVSPAAAAGALMTWQCDSTCVEVTNGQILAVSAGQAVVTCAIADDPTVSTSCQVKVVPISDGEGIVAAPETQTRVVKPGEMVQVDVRFSTLYAAYAKLGFSYDSSALELVDATVGGAHVTMGPNAIVLAVARGRIPDGTQTTLTFAVKADAALGEYDVDVVVTECYTIDEMPTSLYAVAADSIQVGCVEHVPTMIAPVPATRESDGLSAGWICDVCGETLSEPAVIDAGRCLWLPEGLMIVESEAFANVSAQQVALPNGATRIESGAFRNCHGLLVAIVPASVTDIADDAFEGCENVCIVAAPNSAAMAFAEGIGIPCAAE